MIVNMYHTKKIGERIALEGKLEGFVLEKVALLQQDQLPVGEVMQIFHGHNPSSYLLQGELYYAALPSDIFFEKMLVSREHVFEPLHLEKPLEGIVISKKSGIILADTGNHLLIRPERVENFLGLISFQEKERESFASYRGVGMPAGGFRGLDYIPSGVDGKERKFIAKDKMDSIRKESLAVVEDGCDVTYEIWNGEKVSRTASFGEEFQAAVGRDTITLTSTYQKNLAPPEKKEGIVLCFQEIAALEKLILLYNLKTEDLSRISFHPAS